jgi:hypothetical protein
VATVLPHRRAPRQRRTHQVQIKIRIATENTIVLDAGGLFDWIVTIMKKIIFAALVGMAVITGGCVKTVSDTRTPAVWFGKDRVEGRYERSIDQVYRAAFTVIGNNGVVVTEYIPHDTSGNARSLQGKVDQCNVWVRVASEDDPKITSIVVEARTKWGNSNIELAHQLEKDIALQLQTQSGS